MYIEEITLEGFKSYATRVTVPNFDPFFNAITGLNGSGKSNILDSICFVLGSPTCLRSLLAFAVCLNVPHHLCVAPVPQQHCSCTCRPQ